MDNNVENSGSCSSLSSSNASNLSSVQDANVDFSSIQASLKEAIENTLKDEKEMEEQLEKFNAELLVKASERKIDLEKRIIDFYFNKRRRFQKAINDLERLENFFENSSDSTVLNHLNEMKKDFFYSLKNYASKSINLHYSVPIETGSFEEPYFELPIKQTCINLKKIPDKIISTNEGFFALIKKQNKIIHLGSENPIKIADNRKLHDISSSYDKKLSYIFSLKDDESLRIAYQNQSTWIEKCLKDFEIKDNTIINHGIDKEKIILRDKEKYLILNKIDFQLFYKFELSYESSEYYIFERPYIIHEYPIGYSLINYKTKSVERQRPIIQKRQSKNSLYKDFINEIIEGKKVIFSSQSILIFSKENEKIEYIDQDDLMEEEEELIEYFQKKDEIIICCQNIEDGVQIHIKHFPIFQYSPNAQFNFIEK